LDNKAEYADIKDILNQLDNKVDKETGKSLTSNDFTDNLKSKLESLSNYDDTNLKNQVSTIEKAV